MLAAVVPISAITRGVQPNEEKPLKFASQAPVLKKSGHGQYFERVPHFWAPPQGGETWAKKLVVKPRDFTYQFGQMHRVGAGGKLFLPQFVVYKTCTKIIN